MNTERRFLDRWGLWVILTLALVVRLAPVLFQHQLGREAVEIRAIAESLRAGRGFLLPIKSRPDFPGPVEHIAATEHPVLPPILLAVLRLVLPPDRAAQWLGPFLFIFALALVYKLVLSQVGPGAAFSVGVLAALQPALLEVSLAPVANAAALAALALMLWTHYDRRSAILTGLACTVAYLTDASLLPIILVFFIMYLWGSIRSREIAPILRFTIFAMIGPLWLATFNHAMGASALSFPRSFLWHALDASDGVDFVHRNPVYENAWALWRAQPREATLLIAHHAIEAARVLVSARGLGLLIALAPLAIAGLGQAPVLWRFRLLLMMALISLATAIGSWFSFDPIITLGIPFFLGLVWIVLGSHEILDREPLGRSSGAWRSAAFYLTMMVAGIWLVMDAGRAWTAVTDWRAGRVVKSDQPGLWTAPGVGGCLKKIRDSLHALPAGTARPVVASNEPWLVYALTSLPAVKVPYDLSGEEWLRLIEKNDASIVVLHLGSWPGEKDDALSDLNARLTNAGWMPWFNEGQIQAWHRPEPAKPVMMRKKQELINQVI